MNKFINIGEYVALFVAFVFLAGYLLWDLDVNYALLSLFVYILLNGFYLLKEEKTIRGALQIIVMFPTIIIVISIMIK